MRLSNARVFVNGAFVRGGIDFDTEIRAVGEEVAGGRDAGGCYLIPGLIDLHTHGIDGADAGDGDAAGLLAMSRAYAARGITGWCASTMTLGEAELTAALHVLRDFTRPADGARLLGVHLEGPFVSREKCGAQNPDFVHAPDIALFRRLNEASGGLARLVTVAPETPGAPSFIREASRDCVVALGHTAADYDTAMAAYAAGATHTTHLYNAMPPLHHRAPGVIAAAFDAGATVELIADGLHVHPAVVRLTQRLFGDRLALISDSLRCAGRPDGDYTLGGQPITLRGGRATLRGSDTLAGSALDLGELLRRAVGFGIPLAAAVTAATKTPAAILGRQDVGTLARGRKADFVLLNDDLKILSVFVDGREL